MHAVRILIVTAALVATLPLTGRAQEPPADESAEVKSFLIAYDKALKGNDAAWLTAHVTFPLPVAASSYDMEAKTKKTKIATAKALLAKVQLVALDAGFVTELVKTANLSSLHSGIDECTNTSSTVNWKKGEPAIVVKGADGTVTFISGPCDAETAYAVFKLKKASDGWRLVGVGSKPKN